MNETTLQDLPERYLAALRLYLETGAAPELAAAESLGRAAVTLRLETLDVVLIHQQALSQLLPMTPASVPPQTMSPRGALFFTEVILPIETNHPAARNMRAELAVVNLILDQRTLELADSQQQVQQHIRGRESAVAALTINEEATMELLLQSRLLESDLQTLTSADEEERRRLSLELRNEIAQTLLGIHVRLLSLKREASLNSSELTGQITTTQRLVEQSVHLIQRYALDLGLPHAA